MRKTHTISNDETGFASIVIALVLILVLALLTVGFAQLARREQQSALDKQLAVQANYAAESGINNAVQDLATPNTDGSGRNFIFYDDSGATPITNADPKHCMGPNDGNTYPLSPSAASAHNAIDSTKGVTFTCLLVNLTPPTLQSSLSPDTEWNQVFSTTAALSNLTVNWHTPGSTGLRQASDCSGVNNNIAPTCTLPPVTSWGGAPAVVQFSLTPLPSTGFSRANLMANDFTVYLYPTAGANASVNYSTATADKGQFAIGGCDSSGNCSVTIAGILGTTAGQYYLLHAFSYYGQAILSTSATDSGGVTEDFTHAQAIIDVTGQAKNVLKRLQAVVPLQCNSNSSCVPGNTPRLPNFAVQGQDICKEFSTYGSNVSYPSDTVYSSLSASCKLDTVN